MADRVFEDRVGLWVVSPDSLPGRASAIATFGDGVIRDAFIPETAALEHKRLLRSLGLGVHLWIAPHRRPLEEYVAAALDAWARLELGACDLNIETDGGPDLRGDDDLQPFMTEVHARIRQRRRTGRVRFNVAPWKGQYLPVEILQRDPNTYSSPQNYEGNMDELLSADDVIADHVAWGVPAAKVTCCYAARCRVLGSTERVRVLPSLGRRKRGTIFHDDLMAAAGLL